MVPLSAASSRRGTPSSSASPEPQEGTQKKRKRASKPKVRTGCLTCKIRRVKCGEEKPACVRCTSTGRTCDGYDKVMPQRTRDAHEISRAAIIAHDSYMRACSESKALRTLRPLVANFTGSEKERLYFHRFRTIAEDGLFNHIVNKSPFWFREVPQLSYADEAVKHAVIALGAAYQIYGMSVENGMDPSGKGELEIFAIQQYSKAMSKLQSKSEAPMSQKILVTLFCCAAFVCIEVLRENWFPALTHLANGLRIVESLPDSTLDFLRESKDDFQDTDQPGLNYLIRLFVCWEFSCAVFAGNFKPVICVKLYEDISLDATPLSKFDNLTDAHAAIMQYVRHVCALMWLTAPHEEDQRYWAQPEPKRRREILLAKGEQLDKHFESFMSRPDAPKPGTPEFYSVHLDMLYYRVSALACLGLPHKTGVPFQKYQTKDVLNRYAEIVSLAETIHKWLASEKGSPNYGRLVTVDCGIVTPLFYVSVNCSDPGIQAEALRVIKSCPTRENIWDPRSLKKLFEAVDEAHAVANNPIPGFDVPNYTPNVVPTLQTDMDRMHIESPTE